MIQIFAKSLTPLLLGLTFLAFKINSRSGATQETPNNAAAMNDQGSNEAPTTFVLTEGAVNWSINFSIGNSGHQGTIWVENGELQVKQGQLQSGTVTLDMNSIRVTDIQDPAHRLDLENHLKDSDFFETKTYPKAKFVFSEVSPSTLPNTHWMISGNLTVKGITAPVKIPVKVSIEGDVLRAESDNFTINRTTWGINYQSGIIGTAKDSMIDDLVTLSLKVVAKKK